MLLTTTGLMLFASHHFIGINLIPISKLSMSAQQPTLHFDTMIQELLKYDFTRYFYGMYPPLLLPWYRHPEKPWPLIKKQIKTDSIVREASSCTMEVDVTGQDQTISLRNTGAEDISMTGVLIMTNLATGAQQELDFFLGEASVLNNRLSLLYKGKRHPLLWSNPEDLTDWYGHIQHPGKENLFSLEKSFRDVKAFSL